MKYSSKLILVLTIFGLLALLASAFYFGAPLFGSIIIAAIILIFLFSQWSDFKLIQKIEIETDLLKKYSKNFDSPSIEGELVAERISTVKELSSKKNSFSSQWITEVLDAKTDIHPGRSMGGVVVMLGLLGTFFGLMLAVSTAGLAVDNSSTQNTFASIQSIFSNMKGIFGTSLAGLFAALILNASHALADKTSERFAAKLDRFTLVDLIPFYTPKDSSADSLTSLFEEIQKSNLKTMTEAFVSLQTDSLEELKNASLHQRVLLEDFLKTSQKNWSSSEAFASETLQNSIQNLADQFSQSLSKSQEKQNESLALMHQVSKQIVDETQKESTLFAKSIETEWANLSQNLKQDFESLSETINTAFSGLTTDTQQTFSALGNELQNSLSQFFEKSEALLSSLQDSTQSSFTQMSESSIKLMEVQSKLIVDVDAKTSKELESAAVLTNALTETATMMRVNQSELSASIEALREGFELVIDKLSGNTKEREGEFNFVEQLQSSLQAFHERASEVLLENAVKTQEILLEVLEYAQRASVSPTTKPEL